MIWMISHIFIIQQTKHLIDFYMLGVTIIFLGRHISSYFIILEISFLSETNAFESEIYDIRKLSTHKINVLQF